MSEVNKEGVETNPTEPTFFNKHWKKILTFIIAVLLSIYGKDVITFMSADKTVIPVNDSIGIEIDTVLLDRATDSLILK